MGTKAMSEYRIVYLKMESTQTALVTCCGVIELVTLTTNNQCHPLDTQPFRETVN